ncbi:MAG: hypothetical protein KatS3mg104_3031 [Phycisphaerae bacterium]|nr:MAG: hypothetical protein KatS3mg104_3031 [Phycisphaerae bacterium]
MKDFVKSLLDLRDRLSSFDSMSLASQQRHYYSELSGYLDLLISSLYCGDDCLCRDESQSPRSVCPDGEPEQDPERWDGLS